MEQIKHRYGGHNLITWSFTMWMRLMWTSLFFAQQAECLVPCPGYQPSVYYNAKCFHPRTKIVTIFDWDVARDLCNIDGRLAEPRIVGEMEILISDSFGENFFPAWIGVYDQSGGPQSFFYASDLELFDLYQFRDPKDPYCTGQACSLVIYAPGVWRDAASDYKNPHNYFCETDLQEWYVIPVPRMDTGTGDDLYIEMTLPSNDPTQTHTETVVVQHNQTDVLNETYTVYQALTQAMATNYNLLESLERVNSLDENKSIKAKSPTVFKPFTAKAPTFSRFACSYTR